VFDSNRSILVVPLTIRY